MVDVNSVFRGAQYYTAANDSDAVADLADKLTDQVRDHIRKMVRHSCSSTALLESLSLPTAPTSSSAALRTYRLPTLAYSA